MDKLELIELIKSSYCKRVIIDNHITKEIQKRKHKKKRINKKWLKKYGTKIIPDDNSIYVFGDRILATEKGYERLKKIIENMNW